MEPNRIICGDALGELAKMPENSVDAVIMDPPYCSGAVGEVARTSAKGQGMRQKAGARFGWFVGDNMGTAGLMFLLRSVAVAARQVVHDSGSIMVFADWRQVVNIIPMIESAGLRFQNLIVWDKGHMGMGTGFRAQHELIAHFTNGAPTYHDKSIANVIRCPRVHVSKRSHPTEKPLDLLAKLMDVVVPPGGIVLDPFAGSGSTLVAAKQSGRHYIGVEIDPAYVAIAQDRLAQSEMKLSA